MAPEIEEREIRFWTTDTNGNEGVVWVMEEDEDEDFDDTPEPTIVVGHRPMEVPEMEREVLRERMRERIREAQRQRARRTPQVSGWKQIIEYMNNNVGLLEWETDYQIATQLQRYENCILTTPTICDYLSILARAGYIERRGEAYYDWLKYRPPRERRIPESLTINQAKIKIKEKDLDNYEFFNEKDFEL